MSNPLSSTITTMVTAAMKHEIESLAIQRSRPGEIVKTSDIVREALSVGLSIMRTGKRAR